MPLIVITERSAVCADCGAIQDAPTVVYTTRAAETVLRTWGWRIGKHENLCPRCNPSSQDFDEVYRDIRTGARPPDR